MSYISFEDVCKDYPAGNTVVHASDHVNFHIEKGEFLLGTRKSPGFARLS